MYLANLSTCLYYGQFIDFLSIHLHRTFYMYLCQVKQLKQSEV